MKILNIIGISAFQIISCLFVVAYLFGMLNNYFSDKNNYCVMTYMFEYPQFVRITLEDKQFPQYSLYAYSEGRFTERARKMWFDGIPVLFLPGNSGSHMQARSLASVALRKALSKTYEYHFDYFTISYNEELSGLYGGVLQYQTQFASMCITKILSLYKSNKYTKSVPSSVILIGHSMGGLIAKRLLTYPSTINTTNIAITLAAPLEAPVINFDTLINDYYMHMKMEWKEYSSRSKMKEKKFLISIGSGPRDMLIPASLTSSNISEINALATAIPSVWVSPDHVSIIWCKQLVLVINRFLFDIIDKWTEQVTENSAHIASKSRQYFQANHSMTLDPLIVRHNVTMQVDAFWYEDNRRIYQISRPEIERTTHLMIRLVSFPQNRFVAVESINVNDKDWIFGCTAKDVHSSYRYCKEATSLSELSRWSGAATDFGKRKLATIHLHDIMDAQPTWTHVIVKVSPTRKPIVLNVDINDHASRQIDVTVPSDFSFGKQIIKSETEANSLYYEVLLADFNVIHQAYLLYVEPTETCQGQYHVSAEVHIPWADNHNYYHYFTHLKRSPMKLRLFKSNPNTTLGLDAVDKVKITILLDPKCTFSISISPSWYHRLAQLSRAYSPVLVPYAAAVAVLAARGCVLGMRSGGCPSALAALAGDGLKPYYALVGARLGTAALASVPLLAFLLENSSWNNLELQYFVRSLLVLPTYMTALGIVNVTVLALLAVMVFSSQLAHRLLLRIVWRGSTGLAEKMATGLQKVPLLVSAALVCGVPLSCGAASLAAGATFYMFMLSKMYEEYLEDYVYRLMAKVASKICYMFKSKKAKDKSKEIPVKEGSSTEVNHSENLKAIDNTKHSEKTNHEETDEKTSLITNKADYIKDSIIEDKCESKINSIDRDLNNINFHFMMFLLWMCVTVVNIPALLTWARNFKYSIVLKPDTSYYIGLMMSACSAIIWQMNGPRMNLKHYEEVSSLLFTMAVFILALGPFSLIIVNYGVTFMFVIITIQQLVDSEDGIEESIIQEHLNESENSKQEDKDKMKQEKDTDEKDVTEEIPNSSENLNKETPSDCEDKPSDCDECNENSKQEDKDKMKQEKDTDEKDVTEEIPNSSENLNKETPSDCEDKPSDCDECNENRIYNIFQNLREKFSFGND